MKYANLHLHTNYSDGVLTPLELCRKAKAMGYGALAITDHNTVSGWKAFRTAAEAESMGYLLGMDCNVMDTGRNFHIVAYDFDPTAPGIAAYIRTNEETMYFGLGGHPGFLLPEGVRKEDCAILFPGMEALEYISASPAGYALPARKRLRLTDGRAPYQPDIPDTWIFEDGQVQSVGIATLGNRSICKSCGKTALCCL